MHSYSTNSWRIFWQAPRIAHIDEQKIASDSLASFAGSDREPIGLEIALTSENN
jgi:hypothetical protein